MHRQLQTGRPRGVTSSALNCEDGVLVDYDRFVKYTIYICEAG
jgi:hypothetical protein